MSVACCATSRGFAGGGGVGDEDVVGVVGYVQDDVGVLGGAEAGVAELFAAFSADESFAFNCPTISLALTSTQGEALIP